METISTAICMDKGKGTGLAMVPKLKFEHIHLTPFSKMKVDLAAQVRSYFNEPLIIISIHNFFLRC